MKLLVVIGDDAHLSAISNARQLGVNQPYAVAALNAPLDVEIANWLNNIWDTVEAALDHAYRDGMEAAQPWIDKVGTQYAELSNTLTNQSEAVRRAIAERLEAYLKAAIDLALRSVRPGLTVGGSEFRMVSLTVEQKIKLSGSMKASLTEVCQFVAEGEISLAAQYASDSR